ncbi:hypothetical protein [Arenibaculum pallidiluteum]|uniref:hypothetical protein n=1 Tax=Arenibaculum pallidiluteum TaxID=2812559 RepID=UPI001A967AC8|nr:hypothetical protein [Arenibaculum pallidiluteum]
MDIPTALMASAAVFAASLAALAALAVAYILHLVRRRRAKRIDEDYKALVRRAGGARY